MSDDMVYESVASFDSIEVAVIELQQRLADALALVPEQYRADARVEVERFGDEWSGEYLQYHVTYRRPRTDEEQAAAQTFLQIMPGGEVRFVTAGSARFFIVPAPTQVAPHAAQDVTEVLGRLRQVCESVDLAAAGSWAVQAKAAYAKYRVRVGQSANGLPYAAGFSLTATGVREPFASSIRSANFVEGRRGWELRKDGSLRFFG